MIAIQSLVMFTLERVRCALLALAAIILLKIAVFSFLAPLTSNPEAPGATEAHVPLYAAR